MDHAFSPRPVQTPPHLAPHDKRKELARFAGHADLGDRAERLILADALDEAGRPLDAALARATWLPVELDAYGAMGPRLWPGEVEMSEHGRWVECRWAGVPFGGCWLGDDGDLEPFAGRDLAGGARPTAAWYADVFRLGLTDEQADELTRRAASASYAAAFRRLLPPARHPGATPYAGTER